MWRHLIIIGVLLGAGVVRAQGPKLRFTHLSGEQGLSNSTIEAIYQDSRGFIWIGTRDGLNRYDGHEMVVYRNDPRDSGSISDGYVRCIFEDRDQQLWIGTVNGLNRLDRPKDRFTRWKHRDGDTGSLSNSGITALLEDHKDKSGWQLPGG